MNNINVLHRSSIVSSMLLHTLNTRVGPYNINGMRHNWVYFLVDGIYPANAIFTKTIDHLLNAIKLKYATRHKHVMKDTDQYFGMLVSLFRIMEQPLR